MTQRAVGHLTVRDTRGRLRARFDAVFDVVGWRNMLNVTCGCGESYQMPMREPVSLGEVLNVGPGSVMDKVPPGAVDVAVIYVHPETDQIQLATRMSDDDPKLNAEIAAILERALKTFRRAKGV